MVVPHTLAPRETPGEGTKRINGPFRSRKVTLERFGDGGRASSSCGKYLMLANAPLWGQMTSLRGRADGA
jgi:hypothetical protein